jgi:nucleotide-binding universal stress UspA family protein
MSYSSLMVHVDVDAELGCRVDIAAGLAERFHAHLIGVAGWAPMSVFLAEDARNERTPPDFHFDDMQTLLDRKGEQFKTAVRALNGEAEWRSGLDLPTDLLAREARAADLVIIGNQQENQDPFRALDPGSFVLKAGRPVLVVPKGVASFWPKHVAIAWKDAREARRAVLDALPFLQQAETVMIVEILDSGSEPNARAIEDVGNYLTRHGIKTIAERLRPADVTAANSLLRLIEDENINLMVAGAYGHSRLGEWAFGGVTRDLLQESPICCLFAH